ncbi:uncharacterized protein [Temnothorax longispinosus]|uniref:uncharacterized protein n=1 Tax=Temnothorax longispinosus TaxID=300112 RepID=UPI003A9A481E
MSDKSYRWKGKLVTKALYEKRLAQRKAGIETCNKRRKVSTEPEESNPITNEDVEQQTNVIDGRRIVDLNILGQQLWCCSCTEALSLQYIESEIRSGLGSLFLVRCHKCLVVNKVCTGTQQYTDKHSPRFDINSEATLGILHCGLGWTHFQKMLACMNVPCMNFNTFKKYEQEVGVAAEEVANESCVEATALERKLTIENAESIEKLL